MISLWEGLRRHLDDLAAPERLPDGFLEAAASHFLNEGFDGCSDILEVVAAPTLGAGNHVIVLRVGRAFYSYAARAAQDRVRTARH